MKAAVILAFLLSASSSFAANNDIEAETNLAMASGLAKMAAQMNEMALACKHMSSQELAVAKEKQRSAAISDLKIGSADYDKIYSAGEADFKKKWTTMPAQKQKESCDQMKAMSKQSR